MRKFLIILASLAAILVAAALYLDLHYFLLPQPQDLGAAIQQQMSAAKIPGVSVAVIKDKKIIFSQAYGIADQRTQKPVTQDSLFTIASVSKTVTGTALMKLYEQGKFKLDDDINLYLPFPVRNPAFPDKAITFRMLLTHTSSIQDGPSYEANYTLRSAPGSQDSPIALGDYLSAYFTPGGKYYDAEKNFLKTAPGTTHEYSNVGFGLLGYLIETISQQPFDQFCQVQVFTPLGMSSTRWFFRDVDQNRMAVPTTYSWWQRAYQPIGFYGYPTYPDGALKTSPTEYARLMALYMYQGKTLDGKPYLQESTVAEMLKPQLGPESEQIGLVWFLGNTIQHTGGDPGIITLAGFNPKKDLGIILFTNGDGGGDLLGNGRSILFLQNVSKLIAAHY
jgi:CubicO group peptidase (beta-lactamase class C family)